MLTDPTDFIVNSLPDDEMGLLKLFLAVVGVFIFVRVVRWLM